MYYVTGTNLYGQWFMSSNNKNIIESIQLISPENKYETKFDVSRAKLITSCYSYNVFEVDNKYFLVGAWKGNDNKVIQVPFHDQCRSSIHPNLLIAGNDYTLIMAEIETGSVWLYDFESQNYKKVKITEKPILASGAKKPRTTNDIIKVVATNNTYVYLTSEGNVYTGLFPSYLDTRHCYGNICDVECGHEHYILLTDKGRVYTWGNGRRLQLGHGDVENMELPTEVKALAGIKITKIRAGGWHSVALSEFGDVYVWGWNDAGQLGMNKSGQDNIGAKKNYATPLLVDLLDENGEAVNLAIKDIACGTRHSALLLEDGSIWTAGWNKYGQLGFSPKKYEKLNCFKKSFCCPNISSITCGPWNTIVEVIS